MTDSDESTVTNKTARRVQSSDIGTDQDVPCLTILFHPDSTRCGETAHLGELLVGREARLARQEPEFSRPGEAGGRPLADRHLSRSSIRIRRLAEGGLRLRRCANTRPIRVSGRPLTDISDVSSQELKDGVLLELSGRILLLLHNAQGGAFSPRPDLGLIGHSSAMMQVRQDIRSVADLATPVMLRGETGTGKELAARAIHKLSSRRGPFVSVNMAALPASLAVVELFGSVKGAYTGSVRSQPGYFRRAHRGTLFLDEIGEAAGEIQAMLLRALESGEVYPVGAQHPEKVDVRLIAATDSNLELDREFRAPLLHRLSGFVIRMPPLRERRGDLGLLTAEFMRRELEAVGDLHRIEGDGEWLPCEIMARLAAYDWPGNVRQLHNVVRQLVISARGNACVEWPRHLDRMLSEESSGASEPQSSTSDPSRRKPNQVTDDQLVTAMRNCRWEPTAAAQDLGVSKTSLYALMDRCPEIRKAGDLSPEEIKACYLDCGGDLGAMVDRLRVSRHALRRRVRELL